LLSYSADQVNIQRRQPIPSSFFSNSNESDIKSCFNIENKYNNTNTKVINANTNIKAGDYNKADLM